MKKQVSKYEYKIFLILMKYIPFFTTVILIIHVSTTLCNIRLIIPEILAGGSVLQTIIIYSLARVLKFCWVYHSLLWYSIIVEGITTIHRYYQIEHLQELGYITLIVGVFLVLYSILFKCIWKKQPLQEVNINQ